MDCDLLVIGAGAAGMPAAIFAARAGAAVMLVEAADRIGGTFHLSSGQMSAAGTRIQADKGIADSPDRHYAEVMAISRDSANPALVRKAVDGAADTLHWLLDNGLTLLPEHPIVHYGHEPYRVPRTYWSPGQGRAVMDAIRPQLEREIAAGRVALRLSTKLVELMVEDGAVAGARVSGPDGERTIRAQAVLLATGGFTANAELFAELSVGKPRYGGGYPYAQGDGLRAATAIGGSAINQGAYLPTFAAVEHAGAHGGYTFATQTYPQFRQPWELYVDLAGRRFVREDEPSVDARERALLALPDMRFWAIYDARIRSEAPDFFNEATRDEIAARFDEGWPGYVRADSIPALAAAIGADGAVLAATIRDYGDAIARAAPDAMGREHRPLPIAEAPFYAVRHAGWSIAGFAGLAVDAALRVIDAGGAPIPNLYAAGEILGLAATSGNSFCGGMSVTPAMTFGRLLGGELGAALVAPSALVVA